MVQSLPQPSTLASQAKRQLSFHVNRLPLGLGASSTASKFWRGTALVMRPLLLHASSSCAIPKSRRVIHLEFASAELPHGLDWHDRVAADRPDSVSKFDKISL